MVRRSVLFAPGDKPELLRNAPESGADTVVFDLEDGVAPAEKQRAREAVASILAEIDPECELCVRINPLGKGAREDLDAVVGVSAPDTIVLPKVESGDDVHTIAELSQARGVRLPVFALLETAQGVLRAEEIASAGPTTAVALGGEDLAADVGASRTPENTEVQYARQHVVLAAGAAGVDAIDILVTNFEETDRLERETTEAIEFGFDGKMAIHPRQVDVINDAFTPGAEELDWAERVLAARDRARESGKAVFAVDGEMIDAPLITQAERIIARAEAAGER